MDLLRQVRSIVAALLLAAVGSASTATAAVPNEYALKSVFLYNFCRFIDWPEIAFDSPSEALVIGVLGDDPFGAMLVEAVQGERFHGRPIQIEYYRSPREVGRCHLLFVTGGETARMNEVLAATAGKSIVTVGESEVFMQRGGMIALAADRNRVRLLINPDALRAAKLDVSSKLLRVAEITR
jgi:hypothetical protein